MVVEETDHGGQHFEGNCFNLERQLVESELVWLVLWWPVDEVGTVGEVVQLEEEVLVVFYVGGLQFGCVDYGEEVGREGVVLCVAGYCFFQLGEGGR